MDAKSQTDTKIVIVLLVIFQIILYIVMFQYNFLDGIFISRVGMFALVTFFLQAQLIKSYSPNMEIPNNVRQVHKFIFYRAIMFNLYYLIPIISLIIDFIVSCINPKYEFKKEDEVMNNNDNNDIRLKLENYKKSLLERTCPICKTHLIENNNICPSCGVNIDEGIVDLNNKVQELPPAPPPKNQVNASDFDPLYSLSESALINTMIEKTMVQANLVSTNGLIPKSLLIRKIIMGIIFNILVFVECSLFFFHFPKYSYVIGLFILLFLFIKTRQLNLKKYLLKEFKARPSEKMLNIALSVKENSVRDFSKVLSILLFVLALAITYVTYKDPHIIYEPLNDGYAVRFYITGINSLEKAEIPSTYKGKNVISLRGNSFSNMIFLKEAIIPDTVTEIRGEAFLNDKNLVSVKLPSNLEEIKGSMFENCTSLESIVIPDSVTRIGGHAFYNDSSLSSVTISENSNLKEIGSSAFRLCYSLNTIIIPAATTVNERAFKESPTTVLRYGSYSNNYNYNYNYYDSRSGYYSNK